MKINNSFYEKGMVIDNMHYYLAIDIGASSGRHILASIIDNKLCLEEIYRFENKIFEKNNHVYWDIEYLIEQVKVGIKKCVVLDKIPQTLGIDTWGVDYVLLDENNNLLREIYSYRDERSLENIPKVTSQISLNDLYKKTGIQFQPFNTIYQLASENKKIIENAANFLMIPDYLNYILTGEMVNEYTNMSTTQLMNHTTDKLDEKILDILNIDKKLFQNIVPAGTRLGCFKELIAKELGMNCDVIVPATHDTGSAFLSSVEPDSIIISSGTWSLLGIEIDAPIVNEEAMKANFTNEGGYNKKYRFLKNIMGLWIIQEVVRELSNKYSFSELVQKAKKEPFELIFDVNDLRFLSPKSMISEINEYFLEKGHKPPSTVGELAYCIYNSLASSYAETILELEGITNKKFTTINIIGGGSQNELLNEMIVKYCHKKVVVGPIEATAIGNILSQLFNQNVLISRNECRKLIKNSFDIKEYGGKINEY
jgi:rhamnulokinase